MYKLIYFNVPFRGEPARLLFTAAGVKFMDKRVSFKEWPAFKETLEGGQLPILQVGDQKLTQSKAIYRYLGNQLKLSGSDEWQAAKCDEIVDAVCDVAEKYTEFFYKEQDPTKKEEKKNEFVNNLLPTLLPKLDKFQEENGGNWFVGESMTWADIVVSEYIRQFCEVTGDPEFLDGYPQVKKVHNAVFSNENIKAYRGA